MRALTMPVLATAAILAISPAFAAQMAQGHIKMIDTKAGTVTLNNGQVYTVPRGFDLSSLKQGEKVKVEYSAQGKVNTATKITPAG